MVDLPRVSQTFDADAQPYVDAIERMVAENRNLMDSIDKVIGKIGELKVALDSLPDEKNIKIELNEDDVLEQVAYIREVLDGIPDHKNVVVTVEQAGGATGGIKDTLTPDLGDTLEYTAEDVKRLNDMLGDTDTVAKAAGAAVVDAGSKADNALNQASNAARTYHSWWSVLQHDVQLWGGAFDSVDKTLISKVATWHIVLDGLLEATIAVTGAVIALGYAAVALAPAAKDIYDRLKAIETVSDATGQSIPPLTGKFKDLQDAMAPRAIELYGDALNALSGGNMGALSRAITGVVDLLDKWGAEIDIWAAKSDGMSNAIQKGTGYLSQLGQFIANIVVAIQNLMKAEPGVAHFVLDFVDGFSKAFAVLTGISPMLDKVALALHGLMLWGGLLVSIFANLAVGILKPVSALLTFITRTKSATLAIEEFEAANDTAATPVQKLLLTLQAMGDAFSKVGSAIKAWAVGIGAEMAAADGVFASAGAGIMAVLDSIKGGLLALATNPFTWAVVAAGSLIALGYAFSKVNSATTTWLANWNSITSADSASKFLVDSATEISQIYGTQLPNAMKTATASMSPFYTAWHGIASNLNLAFNTHSVTTGFAAIGDAIKDAGKAAIDYLPDLIVGQQAQNSVNAYKQEISQLSSEQQTMFRTVGTVMKQNSVGYAQALGLMDLAGVQASDNFGIQMAKVDGLIKGYQNLGIQGGYLGASINAVTLQSEQQQSQVQGLTQAWTNYIDLVTGGESSFVSAVQQIQGTLSQAGGSAATLSVNNGKVSDSIKGLTASAAGLKGVKSNIDALTTSGESLKSSFIQSITASNASLNSLTELSAAGGQGAKGIKEVDQAGKDYVADLLPLASGSQDATTMLYALAQQAGYTGKDGFGALAQWVNGIKNPMQQAENITNALTISAGNLAKDVQNLSSAIDTDLNQAMATVITGGSGVQKALNNMYNALHDNSDIMSGPVQQAATQLAKSLLDDLAGNTTKAKEQFEALYIQMGYGKTQADQMWAKVIKLAQAIDGLHSKSITLSVNEALYTAAGTGGKSATSLLNPGLASGGRIPGYGGGDIVPALLEPGETVVSKEHSQALSGAFRAAGVPGYAAGGMVAPMLPPAPDLTGLALMQQQLTGLTGNVTADTTQVSNGALAVAAAQAVLTAAQGALSKDQQKYDVAKTADTAAGNLYKNAEKAAAAAKTALDRQHSGTAAYDAAKKLYDADANKVLKDKGALAAVAKVMAAAEKTLAAGKTAESAAEFNLVNKKRLEFNDETALNLAKADEKNTTSQLAQLQKIQAGGAALSSMNDLLLPGTPLATLVAALPGVGLNWGAPDQDSLAAAVAAASAPAIPIAKYDSGGYLPPGLSLALNGTGAPEPVGGGGGQVMHNHIDVKLDGQTIWKSMQANTLRYNTRNNGVPTGLQKPR